MTMLPIKLENIKLDQQYKNRENYLKKMGEQLFSAGLVNEGYSTSIINREEIYPTGLATGEINIAIPHTDYQFSRTTDIFITVLKTPIAFFRMDEPEKTVEVSIIVQILFDNPEKQPDILKELMEIITNQRVLKEMIAAQEPKEVLRHFQINN